MELHGSHHLRYRVRGTIEEMGFMGFTPIEGTDLVGVTFTYDFYDRPIRIVD